MNNSQTQAPIVLVHGILGFNQLTLGGSKVADYFRSIPDALRSDGHLVPEPPRLNPAGSIRERAQDLKNYLESNVDLNGKKVHLIAHSMGGLDARFMISELGMADRVLSLTTIGTPHHGSPIADIFIAGTEPVLSHVMEHLGIDVKGAADLTTGLAKDFNNDVADAPGVRYFCIAGRFEPPRLFKEPLGLLGFTHDIIMKTEGPNDGLVSAQSATMTERPDTWESLESWEANHFREINWATDIVSPPSELLSNAIVEKYKILAAQVVELGI